MGSSFDMFLGLRNKGILSVSYFTILVTIKTLYLEIRQYSL